MDSLYIHSSNTQYVVRNKDSYTVIGSHVKGAIE